MKIKRLVSTGLCVVALSAAVLPMSAAATEYTRGTLTPVTSGGSYSLQWANISSVSCNLSISSSGKASILATCSRTSSGKNTYMESVLQKYESGSWVEVDSWSVSSSKSVITLTGSTSVSKGKYRVRTDYEVTGTSKTESGTIYSTTKTY